MSEKAKRERRDAEEIKEEQVQEVRVDSLFLLLRSSTRERDSGEHGETNNCLPTPTLGDEDSHFNGSIDQALKRDQAAGQSASGAAKR